MSITVKHFGGRGGDEFGLRQINSIGMRADWWVDALILNEKRFGGTGGEQTDTLELKNEYIKKVSVGWDHKIPWGVLIDFLEFETNLGRKIGGGDGQPKRVLNNIRVWEIGGSKGAFLDKISIQYTANYRESQVIERGQRLITDIIPPGESVETVTSVEAATLSAITQVEELTFQVGLGINAEVPLAEFTAKVSANPNIKGTTRREIKREIKRAIANSRKETRSPQPGFALVEVTVADVYKDSNGFVWFFPTGPVETVSVDLATGIDDDIKLYDLTKTLAIQFPAMADRRTEHNGYDFYTTRPDALRLTPVFGIPRVRR